MILLYVMHLFRGQLNDLIGKAIIKLYRIPAS